MNIEKIALSGFRNYDEESVDFETGINVISGPNAQGKTNLLEAIWMLTGAHSFRTRFDKELIGFENDWATILSQINSDNREQTIKMLFKRGQTRQITVNGSKRKSSELSEIVKAVLFCPDDLALIKDGSAVRRRLMDNAICQLKPSYAAILSDFNKTYENKVRILKDHEQNPGLMKVLDEFSDSLARQSARLIRYRASFVQRLNEAANIIHKDFSEGKESLNLEYKTVSTVTDPFASAEKIYYQICEHQEKHKQYEIDSGMCLTGIHKDDIDISINGKSARSFASQGQTRTAALSLKLGEREIFLAETGEYPILLLDDVLSELDEKRQNFVLNRIGGGQTLISCCEEEDIVKKTGGKVYFVHEGRIRENKI